MMVLNISSAIREEMSSLAQAKWKNKGIRYLGIKFSSKIYEVVKDNLINLGQTVKQQLETWSK